MVDTDSFLITNEYVRQALEALTQITPVDDFSPLQFLQIVNDHILTADFSFFDKPHQYALNEILISVIQQEYSRQRNLHDMPKFEVEISKSLAIKMVSQDIAAGSNILVGWAWLFFHYVVTGLYISHQEFSQMANVDERTLRRYQHNVIDQLTHKLIQLEQFARKNQRKRTLYLQLPHRGESPFFIGRENEIYLVQNSIFNHVNVVGGSGIGKSLFVEYVIKEKIDRSDLDQVIWIHSVHSIDNLSKLLHQRLITEKSQITLAEYCSLKRVAIVLDGIDEIRTDFLLFQAFAQDLGQALIYSIGSHFIPMPDCTQVVLKELSRVEARQMIRGLLNENDAENIASAIWDSTGGNPLAIKLLLQNRTMFNFTAATSLTIEHLYRTFFDHLSLSTKLAWLVTCVFDTGYDLPLLELTKFNLSQVDFEDFVALIRFGIIADTVSSIRLTISARHFIRQRYKSDVQLQKLFSEFLAGMKYSSNDLSRLHLALVECTLSSDWLLNESVETRIAIEQFWRDGIRYGHYAQWYLILSEYVDELFPDRVNIFNGYAICLRCLGQWEKAKSILVSVVQYSGLNGLFMKQCEALLELSVIFRYQGEYESATEVFSHVRTLLRASVSDDDIRERLLVEEIEIAIDSGQLDLAIDTISSLPITHPRKGILELEIYAQMNDNPVGLEQIEAHFHRLLDRADENPSIKAHIHFLMARIYEKIHRIEFAIKYFRVGLAFFMEEDNDPFALARTQSNLSALLILRNDLDEARLLLNSAENTQRIIGDRVGLAATMHNKAALDRKFVG